MATYERRLTPDEIEQIYQEKLKNYPEKWKRLRINGSLTKYQVSNYGKVFNMSTGHILDSANSESNKYYGISISHNGVDYKIGMHRLVAMLFCSIPKRYTEKGLTFNDLIPNHKDGVKLHNAAFNLEWITQKENTDHAWRSGFCDNIRGEKSHLSKITEEEAIQICEYIMQKKRNSEISQLMPHVSEKTIQHIRSGECWKHITSRYKFPKLGNSVPFAVSSETIHKICKLLEEKKFTDKAIGEQFGLSREYVRDIRNKKRRTDISSQYTF